MRTGVRLVISVAAAALLEFLFFELTVSVLQPPKREIKEVIKISLVRPEQQVERVSVERSSGKSKEEERKVKEVPEAKLESKEAEKRISERSLKEERKEGGSLKPLQGNIPLSYLNAVRRAIEETIFYPLEAIEKGVEGAVTVQFSVDRNGRAVECRGMEGAPILTEATCIAIKQARFPPIPPSIKNDKLTFQLQIEFNLKRALGD